MALLMEDIELDQTPMFKQMGERMLNWREFDELLKPYLSTHTVAEIVMTAQALRMPFAFVPTAADLLANDHLAERAFFEQVETPGGAVTIPGPPFKMSETPLHAGAAPRRGEANVDVLVGELGYEKSDLDDPERPGCDMSGEQLPLAGLRVIDLTQVFAGPTCTRILADLGADVIRFESASRLDVTRNLITADNDGLDHHWHRSSYFTLRNVNKREMVIDLAKEEGREIVRKLDRWRRRRRRELHAARDGELRPRLQRAQGDQARHDHDLALRLRPERLDARFRRLRHGPRAGVGHLVDHRLSTAARRCAPGSRSRTRTPASSARGRC